MRAHQGQGGAAQGDFIVGIENVSSSAYDDILVASNGNGIIDGFLGNDIIYAGPIGDTLIGGEGIDWLSYKLADNGVGVDVSFTRGDGVRVEGGDGSGGYGNGDELQTIIPKEGGGFTTMKGNSFENLEGSKYDDVKLETDGGDNIIKGLAGNDNLLAANGNDTLIGGAGADFLNGGDSEDTASYLDSPDKVIVDLEFNNGALADAQGDTFSGIENLIGSNYGDTLYGDAHNNIINPSLSNDGVEINLSMINAGLDFVDGRGGIDTLRVDYSIDDYGEGIEGGFNTGIIKHYVDTTKTTLLDRVSFTNIESLVVAGTIRDDSIVGGSGDDTLRMSDGNDFVDGGGGNDKLDGDRGIDTLSDDLSNKTQNIVLESFDIIHESTQTYDIQGTTISNFEIFKDIKTGSGNDKLTQFDKVNVDRVSNNFSTGFGDDTVNAGLGFDTVNGGNGTIITTPLDVIVLPFDNDTLFLDYSVEDTGSGMVMFASSSGTGYANRSIDPNDVEAPLLDAIDISNFENYQVIGTSKDDTIVLGDGNDSIVANAGNDYLRGNSGNDSINAGDGNDEIIGANQDSNSDIDTLTGGTGADLFVLGDSLIAGTEPKLFYDSAGNGDYALITDFNPFEGDVIRIPTCGNGYTLGQSPFSTGDAALFASGGQDLIAIFQGFNSLDLNASYFNYVGEPCPQGPR